MMYDLSPADTRVFLFHSANAAADPSAAMDKVNVWLGKDRSGSPYANLKVKNIDVAPDGSGGVYVTVVCTRGRVSTGSVSSASRATREQYSEDEGDDAD